MLYRIRHRTFYRYGERMSSGQSVGHLTPRSTPRQRVLASTIDVRPEPEERIEWIDSFGNPVNSFVFAALHDSLEVVASSDVEVTVQRAADIDEPWELVMARLASGTSADDLDAQLFALPSPYIPYLFDLHATAKAAFTTRRPFIEAIRALCETI